MGPHHIHIYDTAEGVKEESPISDKENVFQNNSALPCTHQGQLKRLSSPTERRNKEIVEGIHYASQSLQKQRAKKKHKTKITTGKTASCLVTQPVKWPL